MPLQVPGQPPDLTSNYWPRLQWTKEKRIEFQKFLKNITKYCCFQITTYNYTYCTNSIANLCSEYYKDTREMIRRRKTSHSIHTLMNLFCLVNNSNVKSNNLEWPRVKKQNFVRCLECFLSLSHGELNLIHYTKNTHHVMKQASLGLFFLFIKSHPYWCK